IKTRETNVKGYLFISIVLVQIKELIRGLRKDKITKLLAKAIKNVKKRYLLILKEIVAT
ncbi:hypothetical protein K469DRAFT_607814, partial [Zopfia rhizophila CBS 207.26]